ncbi:hypothetical protein DORFOR_00809 [Dorea formicigenerans ATCC 27755]|uniref:Uncharacterized protein n=1 Tax=Dorea formicigenerans ATCC 27755 TaxID=411461 RepID=B0G3I4_9FIRM|nr:hypothetical protein DORFOR_00809 [Dorea formicigenerans ATCC 27755]
MTFVNNISYFFCEINMKKNNLSIIRKKLTDAIGKNCICQFLFLLQI